MPADLPGFYFDAAAKRYFKIQPAGGGQDAYSDRDVKRRRADDEAVADAARRRALEARRVRRCRLFTDPLTGGRLLGETTGAVAAGSARVDAAAAFWAGGLGENGAIPFARAGDQGAGAGERNVAHFCVGHQYTEDGLGVAYATLDKFSLTGMYVPRDEHGLYLMTSRRFACDGGGVYSFSPSASAPLDGVDVFEKVQLHGPDVQINTCAAAPRGSALAALLGTTGGVVQLDEHLRVVRSPRGPGPGPTDILSVDFLGQTHPSVALAGGRCGLVWQADLRMRPDRWGWVHTGASLAGQRPRPRPRPPVTHVRSLDDHHALAAATGSRMVVLDMRYQVRPGTRPTRSTNGGDDDDDDDGDGVVLRFPDYRNTAHTHTGLDVHAQGGVVAAAHDDGTVALFSLTTGVKLAAPALRGVRAASPVRCLKFHTLQGDSHPSLFAGVGSDVRVFSFGAERDEEFD